MESLNQDCIPIIIPAYEPNENLTKLIESLVQKKGAALKTAFRHCLENYPNLIGCVTADSDGQHSPECMEKCIRALAANPQSLVMGSRDFTLPGIPKASIIGNMNTNKIIRHIYGKDMMDTQTGLRGISRQLMSECLNIKFDRFEFEIKMLTLALDSSF